MKKTMILGFIDSKLVDCTFIDIDEEHITKSIMEIGKWSIDNNVQNDKPIKYLESVNLDILLFERKNKRD